MTIIVPTNPSNLGAANQRLILGSIFQNEPVSKAELARILKISKPSIADNVGKLIESDIVQELGEDGLTKAVGRKPIMLSINKNYRYIIVVDFYHGKTVFSMLNLGGEWITEIIVTQTPLQDFDSWTNMSVTAIKTLLASRSIDSSKLAAIGISSPGVIDNHNRILVKNALYSTFDPESLLYKLRKQFSCPIYLKNVTNAYAMGEAFVGEGEQYENIVYISCGIGLGAGIIIGGKLYEGANSGAGEIAKFISPENIGLDKTFEERIGMASLFQKVRVNAPKETQQLINKKEVTLNLISQLARLKDPFILSCIEEIGINLGAVICNLIMSFNPALVIFGGEYKIFSSLLIPLVQKMIDRYCVLPVKIIPSSLEERGVGVGMAVFCRELYFDSICGIRRVK